MTANEVHNKGQDQMVPYASTKDAIENKKHMQNAVAAIKRGLPVLYRSQLQQQMQDQSDNEYQQVCERKKSVAIAY